MIADLNTNLQLVKIINDPVHGFIEVPRSILKLMDTSTVQRLRRIKQLGLSFVVYPGAVHTRFHHALGSMHLMRQALEVLKNKYVYISDEEYEAALIAAFLHDVGHGPFSHALESVIIPGLHHETMTLAIMKELNDQFSGNLSLAIDIFEGKYHRTFLHQLVSGQLDMDRMDYLIRDSFFTGVAEGIIGIDRIIKTLNVYENKLVCESKSIYSIEKFLIARRLMYWQVYLHKAATSAEYMMVNILKRVRSLILNGEEVHINSPLRYFFHNQIDPSKITEEVMQKYIQLDDTDIEYAIKTWQDHRDYVLSTLCKNILNRKLLKIDIQNENFSQEQIRLRKKQALAIPEISEQIVDYFVFTGSLVNQAYLKHSQEPIMISFKSGELRDLLSASDLQNIYAFCDPVVKYYLCFPET